MGEGWAVAIDGVRIHDRRVGNLRNVVGGFEDMIESFFFFLPSTYPIKEKPLLPHTPLEILITARMPNQRPQIIPIPNAA